MAKKLITSYTIPVTSKNIDSLLTFFKDTGYNIEIFKNVVQENEKVQMDKDIALRKIKQFSFEKNIKLLKTLVIIAGIFVTFGLFAEILSFLPIFHAISDLDAVAVKTTGIKFVVICALTAVAGLIFQLIVQIPLRKLRRQNDYIKDLKGKTYQYRKDDLDYISSCLKQSSSKFEKLNYSMAQNSVFTEIEDSVYEVTDALDALKATADNAYLMTTNSLSLDKTTNQLKLTRGYYLSDKEDTDN